MPDTVAPPRPALLRTVSHGPVRLSYVALTDAAPLLVADELGMFAAVGLRVSLSAESAWAALRDKLAFGALDAAHVLGPLPIALACGLGGVRRRLSLGAGLGSNGNHLVLSTALARALDAVAPAGVPGAASAAPLSPGAFARLLRGRATPVRLAVVFPFSSHNYLLRHWLSLGGLDPDRDLRLVVVPPAQAVAALENGAVDGFVAGEPWGSHAALRGAGRVVLTSGDVWPGHPEKMLAFAEGWAERDRDRAVALTAAAIGAARWLDDPANRDEAVLILRERMFPALPHEAVALALDGMLPGGAVLPEAARLRFRPATRPRAAAAAWWLGQMRRWGHLPPGPAPDDALASYDDGLWHAAAARLSPEIEFAPPALPPETIA